MKSVLASTAILAVGLAAVGVLMFAFVQNAEARNSGPHAVGSKLEVAISDNGRVIVRGAEVTEISGDTIRARTEWGATALTWTIRTDGDTDFVTKGGSGSGLDDVSTGDYVSFSGQVLESESAFTVDADAVRNWSLESDKDDSHVRAEAKVEAKARWDEWKKFPIFNWFKGKDDSR
ncbi:MAG: hypothetical protein V4682_03755 [Patescibacteria group bacterium]